MLNGFAMLNTLNRNGNATAPPIDELSPAIIFDNGSPDDLMTEGPLT